MNREEALSIVSQANDSPALDDPDGPEARRDRWNALVDQAMRLLGSSLHETPIVYSTARVAQVQVLQTFDALRAASPAELAVLLREVEEYGTGHAVEGPADKFAIHVLKFFASLVEVPAPPATSEVPQLLAVDPATRFDDGY